MLDIFDCALSLLQRSTDAQLLALFRLLLRTIPELDWQNYV
jgi:hypothetical protein